MIEDEDYFFLLPQPLSPLLQLINLFIYLLIVLMEKDAIMVMQFYMLKIV